MNPRQSESSAFFVLQKPFSQSGFPPWGKLSAALTAD